MVVYWWFTGGVLMVLWWLCSGLWTNEGFRPIAEDKGVRLHLCGYTIKALFSAEVLQVVGCVFSYVV